MLASLYFFHPDYTVGTGIKPVQLYCSRARRHHTALPPVGSRTPPRSYVTIVGPVNLHVKMEFAAPLIYTSNIILSELHVSYIGSYFRGVIRETFSEDFFDTNLHIRFDFSFRMLGPDIC